jgi:hypothetical protein
MPNLGLEKKEDKKMQYRITSKVTNFGLIGLLVVVGLASTVGATNWGDNFTLQITPSGDRGVMIDTGTIAMTLTVGTTDQWDYNIPVTSTGTIADMEYTLAGSNAANWTLSTDGYADTQNEVAVHALFNSTLPTLTDFETTSITKNLVTTTAAQVGDVAGKYEGNQEMDNLGLNIQRLLWVQIKTPPTTSTTNAQNITITVTAEAAN